MPLPKPMPKEQKGEFIQRCLMDSTLVKEVVDTETRFKLCKDHFEKHELNNKKNAYTKTT